jgi:hypothetical protein
MAESYVWYGSCKIALMTMTIDAPHLTILFVATIFALAMAFVWMFCEFERQFGKRLTVAALARFGQRPDG